MSITCSSQSLVSESCLEDDVLEREQAQEQYVSQYQVWKFQQADQIIFERKYLKERKKLLNSFLLSTSKPTKQHVQ